MKKPTSLNSIEANRRTAPTPMMGSTLVLSQMIQDAWGTLSIDMVTCQLSVMGMRPIPMATVHEVPPVKDVPKSD